MEQEEDMINVWHEGRCHEVTTPFSGCLQQQNEWEETMTLFLLQLYSVTMIPVEYMRLIGLADDTVLCGDAEYDYLKGMYNKLPQTQWHSFILVGPEPIPELDQDSTMRDEEFGRHRTHHWKQLTFHQFLETKELVVMDSRRSFFGMVQDDYSLTEGDDKVGLVAKDASVETDMHLPTTGNFHEECSRISCGDSPVVQPVFRVDAPRHSTNAGRQQYLLCEACASACLPPNVNASPMIVQEDSSFLNYGFVCQIGLLARDCSELGICDLFGERAGECSVDESNEARQVFWSRFLSHQLSLSSAYIQETEVKLQGTNQLHESMEQMKKRLRSLKSSVDLYQESYVQHKALTRIPMASLYRRSVEKVADTSSLDGTSGDTVSSIAVHDMNEFQMRFRHQLLKELTNWFKKSFFRWTNKPKCNLCGGNTELVGASRPQTAEEREGLAGIVEVYTCTICGSITRFPRYNHPSTLLDWRQGRCGEWANCFTQCCIAAGYESRYVCDWTDHVWTEVWLPLLNKWVHVDCCENSVDAPLTYESGWGKNLTYVIAISPAECVDVTRRYTKHWNKVLSRRTHGMESWLQLLLSVLSLQWKSSMCYIQNSRSLPWSLVSVKPCQHRTGASSRLFRYLTFRRILEEIQLSLSVAVDLKVRSREEQQGRISGSLDWRIQRGEVGGHCVSSDSGSSGNTNNFSYGWLFSQEETEVSDWHQLVPERISVNLPLDSTEKLLSFGDVLIARTNAEKPFSWTRLPSFAFEDVESNSSTPTTGQRWSDLEIIFLSFRMGQSSSLRGSEESRESRIFSECLSAHGQLAIGETLETQSAQNKPVFLDIGRISSYNQRVVSVAGTVNTEILLLSENGVLWMAYPVHHALANRVKRTSWMAFKIGEFSSSTLNQPEIVVDNDRLLLMNKSLEGDDTTEFCWDVAIGTETNELRNDINNLLESFSGKPELSPLSANTWRKVKSWTHLGIGRNLQYSNFFTSPFHQKKVPALPPLAIQGSNSTLALRVSRESLTSLPTSMSSLAETARQTISIEASAYRREHDKTHRVHCRLLVASESLKFKETDHSIEVWSWPCRLGDWIGIHRVGSRNEDAAVIGLSGLRKPGKAGPTCKNLIAPLKEQLTCHAYVGSCVVFAEELRYLQSEEPNHQKSASLCKITDSKCLLQGEKVNDTTVCFEFEFPPGRLPFTDGIYELRFHRRTLQESTYTLSGNPLSSLYETACKSSTFLFSSSNVDDTYCSYRIPLMRTPKNAKLVTYTKEHLLALCSEPSSSNNEENNTDCTTIGEEDATKTKSTMRTWKWLGCKIPQGFFGVFQSPGS